MSGSAHAELELEYYPTVSSVEVRALRASKNAARSRWRRTHLELSSAAREATRRRDDAIAFEAHDEHLGALQAWKAAETAYIAARLGFRSDLLPPR